MDRRQRWERNGRAIRFWLELEYSANHEGIVTSIMEPGTEGAPTAGEAAPKRLRPMPFIVVAMVGCVAGFVIWKKSALAQEEWEADLKGISKDLHGLLLEFHEEYGRFPTDVIPESEIKTPVGFIQDGTSNSLLGQLSFRFGDDGLFEACFRHLGIDGKYHLPDYIIQPAHRTLETGECGYSYVSGLSLNSPPKTPILLFPMIPGTQRFHPGPLDGKALIITVDGTEQYLDIGKDGKVAELDAKLNDAIKAGTPLDIRHPRR